MQPCKAKTGDKFTTTINTVLEVVKEKGTRAEGRKEGHGHKKHGHGHDHEHHALDLKTAVCLPLLFA